MYSEREKKDIKHFFQTALDSLTERLKKDRYVLALFVAGSFNHDEVWEYSDIDVIILIRDDVEAAPATLSWGSVDLIENGVHFDVSIMTRNQFKRLLEGQRQGIFQAVFSKSSLVFSKDEQINEYYQQILQIGDRDKSFRLIDHYDAAYKIFEKAKKWLFLKNEVHISFWWHTWVVRHIASIEVIFNNEIPQREVVQQASRINPKLFQEIYASLFDGKIEKDSLDRIYKIVETYLQDKLLIVYEPVLEYLKSEGGIRSLSELVMKFKKKGIYPLCQPLVDQGIISMDVSPMRLTDKSRVFVDEPAYFI
jgi:predicted nucleotidyltransferase